MDDVPWLSPDERAAWLSFVRASSAVLEGLDRQLQRDAGVTHSQFLILSTLSMAEDGSARMSEVASALRYSPSRLSHAVRRLETDGWVRRRPDPGDGRAQLVALTEEGWERIHAVSPLHVVDVRARVFDHLTAEQVAQLAAISRALLDGIDDP